MAPVFADVLVLVPVKFPFTLVAEEEAVLIVTPPAVDVRAIAALSVPCVFVTTIVSVLPISVVNEIALAAALGFHLTTYIVIRNKNTVHLDVRIFQTIYTTTVFC